MLASIAPRFNDRGDYLGAFGAIYDLTERQQAEQAVRESELRFRELAELLPAVLLECDVRGRILFANHFAFAATGYTMAEMDAGLSVIELIAAADRERLHQNIESLIAREPSQPSEYLALRKDGTTFPVVTQSSPIIRAGQVIGFRTVAFDITEQRRTARELRLAHDELEQRVARRTAELTRAKDELEAERLALREKNVALREILGLIEEEKNQIVRQVQSNIDRIAMPLLGRMLQNSDLHSQHFVKLLRDCLSDIGTPFLWSLADDHTNLTQRELEICNMVKEGMLSKEIAAALSTSVQTVSKQRAIIRKKLGISARKINLASYLKTRSRNCNPRSGLNSKT